MIKVKKEGIILAKSDMEFENAGVLNPAVIRIDNIVHMFYRAVQLGNHSTIGYCKLNGPLKIAERCIKPILSPEFDYESEGLEDPRIVKIDDVYYMTYTAYDGTNARGALATSTDLIHFKKQGLLVSSFTYSEFMNLIELNAKNNKNGGLDYKSYFQETDLEKKFILWDKNVVFFPRKINGSLTFLHRVKPGIQIASVKNIEDLTSDYWNDYFCHFEDHILMSPIYKHESNYIGSGCPPIETKDGWLLIYHGVRRDDQNNKGLVYSACAALLDLNDPSKVLARLPNALFTPEYEWETHGEVNNVCFPTGTAVFGDTLYIYYGAADSYIACASLKLSDLVEELVSLSAKNKIEVLFITSYPPRECGIATYSQDLITALNSKFSNSLSINVCALETSGMNYNYPKEVKYTFDTSKASSYISLAEKINKDTTEIVLIQHEFGFFKTQEELFIQFLHKIDKPVAIVFHTVLPHPKENLKMEVKNIVSASKYIIVMTNTSAKILITDYGIPEDKIKVIAHGTHLVSRLSNDFLKEKYNLTGRKVLTTFGLLSSGKSIETTLDALPIIIKQFPEIIFLIIGKTHPEVVKHEGEAYRRSLEQEVKKLGIQDHVKFINKYLDLSTLLEYLQLTDIYLFTTNDPNQAVSGTFAYAMSCGCPIISTPIPHAKEVLTKKNGIIIDFQNSRQLAEGVIYLLNNEPLRKSIISDTLQKIASTAWENSAVAHTMLFESMSGNRMDIKYNLPEIKFDHLKAMTTDVGIIQFSKLNQPDIESGYTLDDNARALVATCMYFKLTEDKKQLDDIAKYIAFIKFCQQPNGDFFNYVDKEQTFTDQNQEVNLDDSNGRAFWALGYVVSLKGILPEAIIEDAISIFEKALLKMKQIRSPRAMAFGIKGIFYFDKGEKTTTHLDLLKTYADRLLKIYRRESTDTWEWYERNMTYANSVLPEAMLYSWLMTGESSYKDVACTSFQFLLSLIFNKKGIEVISNKGWLQKGQKKAARFGEQPIDVAYTIMTLSAFYDAFKEEEYHQKMEIAFNWFLGKNRLHQIVYNPCTGGCYDGLEETHANLNQGAESTVSYLMARLTVEK